MLDTFVTSEMSATIVTASNSGLSWAIIDQVRCDVRAATNGDHSVRAPNEGKYQPRSGPESPSLCSTTTPVSHITRSAAGMAKADLIQRRRANNTTSAAIALASLAVSITVQFAA